MTNQRPVHRTLAIVLTAAAAAALLGACATEETAPTTPREQKAADRRAEHMERGRQLFVELDTDKSGSLSAAEVDDVHGPASMLKVHFAEIDRDRDGQLTHEELRVAMDKHHAGHDAHHAEVVDRFDADGDGELSAEERTAAHRFHFEQADVDDSGALSADELRAAPGPGAMMAEHLADLDRDGDGALSYDEITAAMEAHHRHRP